MNATTPTPVLPDEPERIVRVRDAMAEAAARRAEDVARHARPHTVQWAEEAAGLPWTDAQRERIAALGARDLRDPAYAVVRYLRDVLRPTVIACGLADWRLVEGGIGIRLRHVATPTIHEVVTMEDWSSYLYGLTVLAHHATGDRRKVGKVGNVLRLALGCTHDHFAPLAPGACLRPVAAWLGRAIDLAEDAHPSPASVMESALVIIEEGA